MSNLLKRKANPEIPAYGFPLLDEAEVIGGGNPEAEAVFEFIEPEPDPGKESESDPAEEYRKKLLELERRTQEIEKEAYARGFAQGEKDGLEYGQKTVQVIKTQLQRAIDGLESLPEQICSDYRKWFIITCVSLAKRVVRRELAISPEIIAATLSSLLDEAEEHSSLTAYLHPLDIEFIEKRARMPLNSNLKHFSIKPDVTLERGGCRVESDVQLLDASIDSQFEELEKYLLSDLRTEDTIESDDDESHG